MASYKKDGTVWRVQLYVKGVRDSGTFDTKAQSWAAKRETELREQATTGVIAGKSIQDAFDRYEREVSRTKRGHRKEALRLNALGNVLVDGKRFGDFLHSELTAAHVGQLRDMRLQTMTQQGTTVQASTVNRELNLVSHVFSTARKEWKWIADSPTKDVRRPRNPASGVGPVPVPEILQWLVAQDRRHAIPQGAGRPAFQARLRRSPAIPVDRLGHGQ